MFTVYVTKITVFVWKSNTRAFSNFFGNLTIMFIPKTIESKFQNISKYVTIRNIKIDFGGQQQKFIKKTWSGTVFINKMP